MLHRLGANRWKGGAAIFKDPGLRLAVSGFPGYEFQGVGFRPSPLTIFTVIFAGWFCDFPPVGPNRREITVKPAPVGPNRRNITDRLGPTGGISQ